MPTYEMPLLIRIMTKPQLVTTLKRVSGIIFSKGGFIRKIENLGLQHMPYRISAHGHVHKEANCFIFQFDVPPRTLEDMNEEYGRDVDIIRNRVYKKDDDEPVPPCTLHEELLPAPYRPGVQKLVERANRQSRNKYAFKYNTGLSYYPFQK